MSCDICQYNTAVNYVRIVNSGAAGIHDIVTDMDIAEDRVIPLPAPLSNYESELYHLCSSCAVRIQREPEFARRIATQDKCKTCHRRYGSIIVRFSSNNETVTTQRICTRCLPALRRSVEHMNRSMSDNPGTVTNEWAGVIEFKDNACFIWNPLELEIKRVNGRTAKVYVTVTERSIDTSFIRARSINRAFIYDNDVIWILERPHIETMTLHRDILPRGASQPEIRKLELFFVCASITTRNVEEERARRHRQETSVANALDSLAQTSGADFGVFGNHEPMLSRTQFNEPPDTNFLQAYDDAEGRILVWCTCGFRKQIPPTQHSVTHQGLTAVVTDTLYSPGNWTRHVFSEGHIITLQSPARRDSLQ